MKDSVQIIGDRLIVDNGDYKSLDRFGDAWAGCRIEGDILITANREEYTAHELQFLRSQINNWRRIAIANGAQLKISGKASAVDFPLEELKVIRQAMRLLDSRLPGNSMQIPALIRRRRRA